MGLVWESEADNNKAHTRSGGLLWYQGGVGLLLWESLGLSISPSPPDRTSRRTLGWSSANQPHGRLTTPIFNLCVTPISFSHTARKQAESKIVTDD